MGIFTDWVPAPGTVGPEMAPIRRTGDGYETAVGFSSGRRSYADPIGSPVGRDLLAATAAADAAWIAGSIDDITGSWIAVDATCTHRAGRHIIAGAAVDRHGAWASWAAPLPGGQPSGSLSRIAELWTAWWVRSRHPHAVILTDLDSSSVDGPVEWRSRESETIRTVHNHAARMVRWVARCLPDSDDPGFRAGWDSVSDDSDALDELTGSGRRDRTENGEIQRFHQPDLDDDDDEFVRVLDLPETSGELRRRGMRIFARKGWSVGSRANYAEIGAPNGEALVRAGVCPLCGAGPFRAVAIHVAKKHEMSADELKSMIGVPKSHGLNDPETTEHQRQTRTVMGAHPNLIAAGRTSTRAATISDAGRRGQASGAGGRARRKIPLDRLEGLESRFRAGERLVDLGAEFGVGASAMSMALKGWRVEQKAPTRSG